MVDEFFHWAPARRCTCFLRPRTLQSHCWTRLNHISATTADQHMSLDTTLPETVAEKIKSLRTSCTILASTTPMILPLEGQRTCFVVNVQPASIHAFSNSCFFAKADVLQQRGRDIVPGVAFRGTQVSSGWRTFARGPEEAKARRPGQASPFFCLRVSRIEFATFSLNLDLRTSCINFL